MKGYIFDLDGTILDSADMWHKINHAFFAKRGLPYPADYQQMIAALPFPEVALYTKRQYNLPETQQELMDEFLQSAEHAYAHEILLKPGAKDYLLRVHTAGRKMAVATAAPHHLLTPVLKNHGIYDLFDTICTTQDVGVGKVKPDVFLLAAAKINTAPKDCIVFDDILAAVQSAKGAGMTVCGLRDVQSDEDWEEITRLADYTIEDFTDFPVL